MEIVEVRPVAAPDRQHVAEATGCHQCSLHSLAFGDCVNNGRPAVDEEGYTLRGKAGVHRLANGVDDADRRIMRRSQRLADKNRARSLVKGYQVGEGAACVRRHAAHRGPSLNCAVAARSTSPPGLTATWYVEAACLDVM